ncbi:MAG: PAS domain S-box protein [Deltaproteobacteria bacterium]|nr:PAS domain S-box protein [Deltaproteobacteria bacterium]MBW2070577.1 PAS domain S-box protein [Deltaproteobacteria bacterium]
MAFSGTAQSILGALANFKRSLGLQLSLVVGVIFLVAVLVFTYSLVSFQEKLAFQRMVDNVGRFSDAVKRSTYYSMLKNQRESLHEIIKAIGAQPGVEKIRIFNKNGAIMFSSLKQEIGTNVDMQAEACYACHRRDRPLERLSMGDRSRIYRNPSGYRVLGMINPIYNEPSCWQASCHYHPESRTVLGVLDIGLSLKELDQEISATKTRTVLFALLMFVAVSAIMAVSVNHFVNKPIRRLVSATKEIANGNYDQDLGPVPDNEIGHLALCFDEMRRNIGEQARALQRSKQEYQMLFEEVPCQITVQDREFRIVRTNRAFEEKFGNQVGEYCYRAYKGRDSKCEVCSVDKTFRDAQPHSSEEVVVKKDGSKAYILAFATPIFNEAGEVTAAMEVSLDITQVRELEEELKRSEEKYRTLFNSDPNPIFVLDYHTLEILDANERALEDYGYSRQELLGRSFLDLADPEERERLKRAPWHQKSAIYKVRHRTRSGGQLVVNISFSNLSHMGQDAIIVTTSDVTERVRSEEQLVQAGKMATLGEMSAGVAHELNQPLSVIKTSSSFLLKKIARGEQMDAEILQTLAEEMDSQVDRASQIINHLRQFGRKTEIRKVNVQLNECIEGSFTVLGRQLEVHGIRVELDLDGNLPPIKGDRNRLEQVFLNLIMNARDAMDEKEALSRDEKVDKVLTIASYQEHGEVVVEIADTGVGMSEAVREKIFEPFFTTKPVGKGTGLGLSISFGIVRDYDGRIEVESVEGQGTLFRLRFPAAEEEREEAMEVAGG